MSRRLILGSLHAGHSDIGQLITVPHHACLEGVQQSSKLSAHTIAGFVVDDALTPSKISTTTFGLKASWDVDGAVYAQVRFILQLTFLSHAT